ncbi:MAG: hypothetical protein M3314_15685, partial [Actinomycetota bacterium]|nr:hypothetical protein [Actinomycetota bacterium]
MARARSIESGDETAGVRVEYVKTRRMVRLGGWHGRDRDIPAIEVPASRFLDELGIAPEELGAAPVYLVLASLLERRTGSLRSLAAAFPSELHARQVFLRLRADHQDPDEWAQVVALDARCRMVPVCWFGTPGELNAGRLELARSRDERRGTGEELPASAGAVRSRR